MRRLSPYSDPAWARASENLAKIMAGNPVENARYEAALTDVKSQQQKDRFARGNRALRMDAGDALDQGEFGRFASNVVRTGDNWGDIGSVVQAMGGIRGANGEISPDQMRYYNAGAGNLPDVDTAYTMGESNAISARDALESQRQAVAKQAMANRSTLEGAAVQDAGSLLEDPEIVRELSMAINADGMTPENVLANSMHTGQTGIEQGIRMDDPLSVDQVLAQSYDDPDQMAHARYGNGPMADAADAASGGGGDSGLDVLDQTRLAAEQDSLETALGNWMLDRGGPSVETDDGVAYDYATNPDLNTAVLSRAAEMQTADATTPGRTIKPDSFYISQAASELGVTVNPATGGDDWIPGNEEPASVTWNNRGGPQQQQTGGNLPVVKSDADYDALPPGTTFVDENGEKFTKPGA